MADFRPCMGKTACRDDGLHCLTCGRTLDEIVRTRDLIAGLTELATEFDYTNPDDFAAYVGHRIRKKLGPS